MIIERVEKLKKELNNSSDIVIREVICGKKNINLIFLTSVVDEENFINGILSPLMDFGKKLSENSEDNKQTDFDLDILENEVLKAMHIKKVDTHKEIVQSICDDQVLLFLDKEPSVLAIDITKYPMRMPSDPPTSSVLKGPREGFVEDFDCNIALLRRRFSSGKLVISEIKIGRYSQSKVALAYLQGVADKKTVKKIKKRLEAIDIDGIVDSYQLIGFLQEKKGAIFKQVGNNEKPDVVAAKILEGRIAIIIENTPLVLTLPFLLIEDLHNSNDYYSSNYYASYIRVIRLIGILVALIAPGVFLSFRLYHNDIVPLNFLITIANSTQAIPFTPFLEIIFILILFEILYEVSLRLPRYLGLATSIVGALILGDTGVKAGLISPPGVMIIALSVISVYTVPDQIDQINLLRAVFIILGAGLGIFGVIGGIVFIIAYMNTMDSYGTAYLAPLSPYFKKDLKDTLIKVNSTKMKTRPQSLGVKNITRLRYGKDD